MRARLTLGTFGARLAIALLLAGGVLVSSSSRAQGPDPGDRPRADDAIRRAILAGPRVPTSILEIRQRLVGELKGTLTPHIVVNGGHDNPAHGNPAGGVKFMVFESYQGPPGVADGELFIGYFLAPAPDRALTVAPGFVELIAWDRSKQVFNFWELNGTSWNYRGDSNDVLADVARVNLGAPAPQFRQPLRLRCSGCHTLGAPVMKELEPPHNDWWTAARKLALGPFTLVAGSDPLDPRHVAAGVFRDAADASNLSRQVKAGIDRLVDARATSGPGQPTLRQELRSLFSTMEMNLVSDREPFAASGKTSVEIPQDFFVDARLARRAEPVRVSLPLYQQALRRVGSRFAPGLAESHHAFVVPARSAIDNRVIDSLLARGLLDDELVADVLAVDFTTPVYSRARASLIAHVPDRATSAADLRARLVDALRQAPATDRAARELLANLTDPARTAEAHRRAAAAYLDVCARAAADPDVVVDWLTLASQRREELVSAETATHPKGNIKEEGFRVIFPVVSRTPPPGQLRLAPDTARAVPN
jgi:hypothetical protein